MGIAERKERQKAELRQRILEASLGILEREGFDALTMRKVADAIEYSPAAIYLYFDSREQIAQALGRRAFQQLLACLQRAEGVREPAARLHAMAQEYARFALENPAGYRLVFMESESVTAAVFDHGGGGNNGGEPDVGQLCFALLQGCFEGLAREGLELPAPTEQLTLLLWTALHGVASLKITCSKFITAPAEELVSAVVTQQLRSLGAAEPAGRAARKARR
jgi:AcrR family transcriptional regulator